MKKKNFDFFFFFPFKVRLSEEKGACDAQILWAACQALARAVKVGLPGASNDKAVRPLEAEIKAVSKVARELTNAKFSCCIINEIFFFDTVVI